MKIEEIITLDPNKSIEIRRIEIENLGNSEEVLEIVTSFEIGAPSSIFFQTPSMPNVYEQRSYLQSEDLSLKKIIIILPCFENYHHPN